MATFHELYERYYRDVYRFALFLTGDHGRAEDLTADTFVRAWVARERINQATVRGYLLAIARNLHRDQLRRQRPVAPLDDSLPDVRPAVDVQVQHTLALASVRERLRHIAKGDRHAFLLFIARGMSHGEIARALGVSVGAVKSRIFRAREALLAPTHISDGEPT
jgi:RNA polymerase sigma-70 factor (ECF subfamily)